VVVVGVGVVRWEEEGGLVVVVVVVSSSKWAPVTVPGDSASHERVTRGRYV
jgi:hypothetical protein